MLRKTSVVALACLINSPCNAGFYLGAGAGPEGADFSQKAYVTRPGTFSVVDKNHFAGTGIFGSLFAGYGKAFNSIYLAAEANANLSSVKYQLTNDEYLHSTFSKTTFRIKHSEGISLLPGYLISPNTLLYGRVGYVNGQVKVRESDPTIRNFNKNRNGIRYGLGIRHSFYPNWSLMMEYSQIDYKSIEGRVLEPFGGVTKTTKITPYTAQVGFGLIYHFDEPREYIK
ncbi:porin family protein [Legionella jordanis]|uniref:outer membrane protein n=1 Tax=Legionella jordanis TaxID=456 RepID=UPI000EFEC0B4|nr:outer membrane beta-barrel protein [Legionella jordanis]RMX15105.1 porin family protein [Legionella jordanis]